MTTLHPLVIGTAGHIDHGKTTLVTALTGIDTDRLPVEKQRGITTELGFAHLDLGDRRVAVVDVPGHERFLRAMVAGAGGIDVVLLVIAADEGVMPQTREHLAVCELLGVRAGVVALTRRDLVDDDWLAMVTADVRSHLAGTFLAHAPLVPVSARTGAGLPSLRAALADTLDALPPRPELGLFRLPIDRVFSVRGFGTVVTGTIASGALAQGDDLVVLPRDTATRARGLEVHGATATRARAGLRCAINLAHLSVDDVARGDVLAHPGAVAASHILDVRFRLLPSAHRALDARTKILVHHGTTQVMATLVLVDATTLAPGDSALAQLRIDAATPLAALPGDRFLARGFVVQRDHGTTLGGGEVLRVLAPRARHPAEHAAVVAALASAQLADRLALLARGAGATGITAAALAQRTGVPVLDAALSRAVQDGALVAIDDPAAVETVYLHAATVAEIEARARAVVDEAHAGERDGLPREELRARLPAALPARGFDLVVAGLAARGELLVTGDTVRRKRAAPAAPPLDAEIAERFRIWAIEPPRPTEVAAATGLAEPAVKAALDRLLAAGTILKIKPDLYMHAATVTAVRARLVEHLDRHGSITPPQWKELTATTRKYSIPLAEFFDGEKLTLRVGDRRRRR